MKLQGVSVIFALIVLPLILVLTYYIQLLVDTIDKQNQYDVKLLNSTYGAMSAFEINTANEDLSTVSDSLRTIIDASTNIFMNTLTTNLGMSNASKSFVEPYIPALLYTLYDGYYISAPTRSPKILIDSDGNAVSVGDIGVTISGSTINYQEVHTSLESQTNCTFCKTIKDASGKAISCEPDSSNYHIIYDSLGATDQPMEYSKMTEAQQCNLQVKYLELPSGQEEIYGQLIYIAKKTNPADPDTYTTNVENAELEIKHVLKTYMPYSARYKNDAENFDITVIYTLDNYVTIEGTLGGISYTKSGYLIPNGSVSVETAKDKSDGDAERKGTLLTYNQNDAKDFIYKGNEVKIKVDGIILSSGGGKSYEELSEEVRELNTNLDLAQSYIAQFSTLDTITKDNFVKKMNSTEFIDKYGALAGVDASLNLDNFTKIKKELTLKINERQYELDKMSSVAYYVTSQIFSNWIYNNFVDSATAKYQIREKDLVEISGQSYKLINGKMDVSHEYETSEALVFNIVGTDNIDAGSLDSPMEIDTDSTFYSHKLNIIRDSIQYNLNLSMSTYNQMFISTQDYAMPVMQNEEWEKILNNISIVSYMQGYNCGLKKYSNYKIVSSTNNEISVTPKEIYYTETSMFSDEKTEYHRINCPQLLAFDLDNPTPKRTYIPFLSKEVKYDKLYDKTNIALPYSYDHKNLACYECVNDGNYEKVNIFDGTTNTENLRKAYYIGVGKVRNNLYKMNAIENSQGFEIIATSGGTSKLGLKDIKTIEIVLNTIKTRDAEENVLNYTVKVDTHSVNNDVYTVVPNIATKVTLKVDVDPNITEITPVSLDKLVFSNIFDQSTAYIDDPVKQDLVDAETIPDKKSTMIVKNSIEFIRVIYR